MATIRTTFGSVLNAATQTVDAVTGSVNIVHGYIAREQLKQQHIGEAALKASILERKTAIKEGMLASVQRLNQLQQQHPELMNKVQEYLDTPIDRL